MDIIEFKNALTAIESKIETTLTKCNAEIVASGKMSDELKADLKKFAGEHTELYAKINVLNDTMVKLQQTGIKIDQPVVAKSIGAQFLASVAFADYKAGKTAKARVEFQNNTITGDTNNPEIVPKQNMDGIVGGAFRKLTILDAIQTGTASGNTLHYTRELLFVNNAAAVLEAGAKPETTLTFEGVDTPVRTIAHFIKLSKQIMDDAPQLASYVDSRLAHGLRTKVEDQIISGDGVGANLSGILDTGNFTPGTVVVLDTDLDAANRWKYQVSASDYMADMYMINPESWGTIERAKTLVDGEYIGADGAVNYINNGLTPTLWGLPVVISNAVPVGTLVVMAMDAAMYFERQGVTVEIFEQDTDNVQKNLLTIRAETRGAFAVFRPSAIVAGELPSTN